MSTSLRFRRLTVCTWSDSTTFQHRTDQFLWHTGINQIDVIVFQSADFQDSYTCYLDIPVLFFRRKICLCPIYLVEFDFKALKYNQVVSVRKDTQIHYRHVRSPKWLSDFKMETNTIKTKQCMEWYLCALGWPEVHFSHWSVVQWP